MSISMVQCKSIVQTGYSPRLNILKLGDPGGNRTRDNLIKSQVLYRLSYRIMLSFLHICQRLGHGVRRRQNK